ncbi:hemolysin family protein [Planomicrobium sp. CPCC 101110]|uniref:hemolysin family protein n=1 Tax=Planomicrobium sp. CPCC 101110 TaxID=2599619 RepID=UPI002106CB62|nr:hemolysin family protein [Planomicrobium sp. CPCC 101110]
MDLAIYLIVFAVLITCAALFSARDFVMSKARSTHANQLKESKLQNSFPFTHTAVHPDGPIFARQLGLFKMKRFSRPVKSSVQEELKVKLASSYSNGHIVPFKYAYASKILEFDQLLAKEIMVPRTEMAILEKNMALKEVLRLNGVERFTRYPIVDGGKDHVIGLVNMKHLLAAYATDPSTGDLPVSSYIQPIIQVIGSIPVGDLLLKIQRERTHMAILRDEYGGTCGLVTIEDIIEEIVGDIQDEFDSNEIPQIQQIGEHRYIFDAKLRIDDVNQLLSIDIGDKDMDTIGGWFMSRSFEANSEQKIFEQGYDFFINDIQGNHIRFLEVHKR